MKKHYLITLVLLLLFVVGCGKKTNINELVKFSTWLEDELSNNDSIISITTYSNTNVNDECNSGYVNVNTLNNQYTIFVVFNPNTHELSYKTSNEELSVLCKEYQNEYNK